MDFQQILDAPIEPGGLVEWIPAVPGGLGSWRRDVRETSHNHEQHLRSAFEYRALTHREGGRESWLGLSIEFDEPMSVPAVRTAIVAYINRHEVLRTHVVLKADRQAHYRTERYTTQTDTVHVKVARIGWYTETPLLLEQIAGSFDRATAPLHWPAYRFATVARPRSFTLLFAADHSLVDGYSLVTAHHELTELYRAAREGRPPMLEPVGSYLDFSDAQRRAADAADTDHRAARTWAEFIGRYGGTMPPNPLLTPLASSPTRPIGASEANEPAPVTPVQPARTRLLLDDAAALRYEDYCAASGASLVGGLLGALAVAFRATTGADDFAIIMPRHTRTERSWSHSLGWFVGLAPLVVDVSDDPPLAEAARRSTEALTATRHGSELPFLRVADLIGLAGSPTMVVSYMDTRATPRAAAGDEGGARVLRSHSYADDEVYVWVNRTPGGIRMHARYPAHGAEEVSVFLDRFADLLARTAKDG
ncbi:condensation domain-containing protein [Gordonia neofelifaecis]|uniref:Condensation domain-containing protein n=1 Tax=Gordonia neofelifaecis NRRL B-59395 TaxID=644548 RepID=F1YF77_9ACTN|nr:condensation domain-containing protein [Gordonia neofelifaecis]EGD56616.1 condensation domain-containing protein [Gordonia neofelifaecis NRRL B-59395]